MNIPSFDDFLKTLTDEDIADIISQIETEEATKKLDTKNNISMMTATALITTNYCLSTFLALLRRYHDWLTKFL